MARKTFRICLATATLAGLPALAMAQSANTIELSYTVDMAGATVLKADYRVDIGDDSFAASLSGKTSGVTSVFSSYKMNLSATGKIAGSDFLPGLYENDRKKSGKKKKSTDVMWRPDGSVAISRSGEVEAPPATVASTLNPSAADPLTAVLRMANSQGSKPCSGKYRVYDGKDVYDLTLAPRKGEGDGIHCKLTWIPVAGNDFDEGDTEPESYALKLSPVVLSTGRVMHVPMQLVGKSKGVTFTVSADTVSVNGQQLK